MKKLFQLNKRIIALVAYTKEVLLSLNVNNGNATRLNSLEEIVKIFYLIMLSIIYPAIWGFYFSLSKYIRMGSTIDLYGLISSISIDWYILFVFLIPHLFLWLAIFLFVIRSIRVTLWSYTETMLYSFHLKALQYYDYFRLCELVYKAHFVYFDVISGNYGATTLKLKDCGIIRRTIAYMFYRPYILHILILSSLFLELLLTHGKLYYGVYTLFFYPFLLGIFHCFHQFGFSKFDRDVCLSDYIVWNFDKPRYYHRFWFYLPRAEYYFGFEYTYPPDLLEVIRKTCALEEIAFANANKFSGDLTFRVWGRKHILDLVALKRPGNTVKNCSRTIITGFPRRWSIRIAGFYWKYNKVRWFHTTRVLYHPISEKIHPLTIQFIKKDPFAILSLLNHPGQNFAAIQKASANVTWPTSKDLYGETSKVQIPNKSKTLVEVLEINFVMRFRSLAKQGVILGTYQTMKEKYGHVHESMQMRPDMVSNWFDSLYKYKGYLGIDQKHKSPTNLGRNQIITDPIESYSKLLENFAKSLEKKFGELSEDMVVALTQLEKTQKDPELHIAIWAESLHLFPDKWKPPLLLDKTFDKSNLSPEALEKLRNGEAYIQRISDELYTLNISTETGELTDEALERFEGSFLQEILGNDL